MLNLGIDMLSGLQLEDALVHNAIHKAQNTPDKTFFLGVLAGFWVGLGGLAGLSVGGGIPESVRADWPILPRFGLGFFFPFALHFIVLFGGELFTGNSMVITIGWLNRKVSWKRMLLNWGVVYVGNFCGCLLTAYLFGYLTESFAHEPWHSYVKQLAVTKTHYGWGVLFLRAIPANVCVCMGVVLGLASRDAAGKILALYFPPVLFVLSAFEHSVANMFFVNIGLMYGAESTIGRMFFNQSAVALGNFIGGAIVVGLTEHIMNHWQSPFPWHRGHPRGTLAAHDVESTRRARDRDRDHAESTAVSASPSFTRLPRFFGVASTGNEGQPHPKELDSAHLAPPHLSFTATNPA